MNLNLGPFNHKITVQINFQLLRRSRINNKTTERNRQNKAIKKTRKTWLWLHSHLHISVCPKPCEWTLSGKIPLYQTWRQNINELKIIGCSSNCPKNTNVHVQATKVWDYSATKPQKKEVRVDEWDYKTSDFNTMLNCVMLLFFYIHMYQVF